MPNPSYVKLDPEALLRKLETEYGPLAFFTSKGEVKQLNERFFAELIAYELSIIHEADGERFYVYNSVNALLEVKSVHALKKLLSDRIRQAGQELSRYSGICRLDS